MTFAVYAAAESSAKSAQVDFPGTYTENNEMKYVLQEFTIGFTISEYLHTLGKSRM